MPDKRRAQSIDANRSGRKQDLTAGVQRLLDQVVQMAGGEVVANDDCFGRKLVDDGRQVLNTAQKGMFFCPWRGIPVPLLRRRHVSGDAVVAAWGRNRVSVSVRVRG